MALLTIVIYNHNMFIVQDTGAEWWLVGYEPLITWLITKYSSNVLMLLLMEQHALKNVNNCLNTNIYFYLETSGPSVIKLFTVVIYCHSVL